MAVGVTTLGGRTALFGGASGLDTSALITAAYNARKLPSDRLQTKISDNTTKIASYSKLQSLSQSVQTSLTNLKKNYSVLSTNASLFDGRTGTLSSSSTTSAQSLLSVAIDAGTDLSSYEIEVQQKALAHKVGGNSATTDKAVALGLAGTFDLGVASGTPVTINMTAGMSLTDLADAINSQKDTSGVSASILKTSTTGFELVLSATDTNKSITVTNITGTDVLQNLGVLDAGGGFANEIQVAQGAIITLDGTPVTRDTNDFSDLITGVGLTVKNAEPGTLIQLNIENDTTNLESGIQAFVDSYNALRDFINTNQTVLNGVPSEDAVLFGDFSMKGLSGDIQSLLASNYGATTSTMQNLRDLGITLDGSNKLVVDATKLSDAIKNNYDEVRAIFETSATSDNTEFRMIANTSKSTSLSAAIDITYSGGAITDVSVGGDNTLFDISGTLITGKAGTAYEGMSFAYVGTTSTTVNFTMGQGLADLLANTIEDYSSTVDGSIQGQKISLDELNKDMNERSSRILERADDYRQKLIDRYSNFESQIARAQTVLAQIQAILNANNNND